MIYTRQSVTGSPGLAAKVTIVAVLSLLAVTFSPPTPISEAGHASSPYRCFGRETTIRGSARGEVIIGTNGINVVRAGKGRDGVFGGGGRDYLCGNRGDDTLIGGDGYDHVNGGKGIDTCQAEVERNCERSN